MSERVPEPLVATAITLESSEFAAIAGWPFADAFVARLLRDDIPQRVRFNDGRIWIYREPKGALVGFGTIDICKDYSDYTGGKPHLYLPLLAVNPTVKSLGYGTGIVQHLVDEATLLVSSRSDCHDVLFLDVYTSSVKAIGVYRNCGFTEIEERKDPQEDGKPYLVMAKRVSVARA